MSDETGTIQLSQAINHIGAPIWWQAEHGRIDPVPFLLACPACQSAHVTVNPTGSIIVERPDGQEVEVPMSKGKGQYRYAATVPGIWMSLLCANGHEFTLIIEQENGRMGMVCQMKESVYEELYPNGKYRTQETEELSDYDEAVSE